MVWAIDQELWAGKKQNGGFVATCDGRAKVTILVKKSFWWPNGHWRMTNKTFYSYYMNLMVMKLWRPCLGKLREKGWHRIGFVQALPIPFSGVLTTVLVDPLVCEVLHFLANQLTPIFCSYLFLWMLIPVSFSHRRPLRLKAKRSAIEKHMRRGGG